VKEMAKKTCWYCKSSSRLCGKLAWVQLKNKKYVNICKFCSRFLELKREFNKAKRDLEKERSDFIEKRKVILEKKRLELMGEFYRNYFPNRNYYLKFILPARERNRRYYYKDHEKTKEYRRNHYKAHKAIYNTSSRRYYYKHREQILQQQKRYRENKKLKAQNLLQSQE